MQVILQEINSRQIQHWTSNVQKLGEAWKMLINRKLTIQKKNLQVHQIFKSGTPVFFLQYAILIGQLVILYYFNQFGCHRSQEQWFWLKSIHCHRSHRVWPASKKNGLKPISIANGSAIIAVGEFYYISWISCW